MGTIATLLTVLIIVLSPAEAAIVDKNNVALRIHVSLLYDDESNPSAIEYAVLNERTEALAIMQEFVEIPNDVKIKRMARLMHYHYLKEFDEMLQTMPVDLVRQKRSQYNSFFYGQVSSLSVPEKGTLLQDAVQRRKRDFIRILLRHGFVFLGSS